MNAQPPATKILVVDDDPGNVELLAGIFEDDYEVLFATHGERALQLARETKPEAILLDVLMPGMDGFEVCRRLKAARSTASIPVIFVTGVGDLDAEVRGLELGAADYVAKPINPPVVRLRVRNQIELKCARDQLTRLAFTDGLTGIANRRYFDDALAQECSRHTGDGTELSLILLDIDHFKAYNDNYGHLQGDDCLRAVARAVDRCATLAGDLAARYGGEEFAVVLPATDAERATRIGEQIRASIAALGLEHKFSSVAPHISVSVGVATLQCAAGRSPLHVLARADELLYRAKEQGRNRVVSDRGNRSA